MIRSWISPILPLTHNLYHVFANELVYVFLFFITHPWSFVHLTCHSFIRWFVYLSIHLPSSSIIHQFIHPLIHSFIRPCTYLFVYAFTHSFTHERMYSCIRSIIDALSFVFGSCIHLFMFCPFITIHPSINPLIYSLIQFFSWNVYIFACWFIRSFICTLVHSFIRSFVRSCVPSCVNSPFFHAGPHSCIHLFVQSPILSFVMYVGRSSYHLFLALADSFIS